eukprot:scaffold74115_cov45-Phaeocystis_antarctica.AAC.1
MFAPSDHHLPRPSAPMVEIRIHYSATVAGGRALGTRRPVRVVRALAPSATWAASARSRAPGGGDGASHACLLVLLCLSRTSTTSIRRHRVCAVVLAQHPTHGERRQLTGCLEGERTLAGH